MVRTRTCCHRDSHSRSTGLRDDPCAAPPGRADAKRLKMKKMVSYSTYLIYNYFVRGVHRRLALKNEMGWRKRCLLLQSPVAYTTRPPSAHVPTSHSYSALLTSFSLLPYSDPVHSNRVHTGYIEASTQTYAVIGVILHSDRGIEDWGGEAIIIDYSENSPALISRVSS